MAQALITGLEQAEIDCNLPTYSLHTSFNKFIKYEINDIIPTAHTNSDTSDSSINSNSNTNSSTNSNVEYMKIITQPRYPVMTHNSDPLSTDSIITLPISIRFSELFEQHFTRLKSTHTNNSNNINNINTQVVIAIGMNVYIYIYIYSAYTVYSIAHICSMLQIDMCIDLYIYTTVRN